MQNEWTNIHFEIVNNHFAQFERKKFLGPKVPDVKRFWFRVWGFGLLNFVFQKKKKNKKVRKPNAEQALSKVSQVHTTLYPGVHGIPLRAKNGISDHLVSITIAPMVLVNTVV